MVVDTGKVPPVLTVTGTRDVTGVPIAGGPEPYIFSAVEVLVWPERSLYWPDGFGLHPVHNDTNTINPPKTRARDCLTLH